MIALCSYVRLFSCVFQPSVCSHIVICVCVCVWGKRPCEPSPTEGKVEQWSTREWEGAWVISALAAHAQSRGRIKVCECIRACLPGIVLFNYFLPALIYPGASFRVGSLICIRPCVCVPVACVSGDTPLSQGLLTPQRFAHCSGMILCTRPVKRSPPTHAITNKTRPYIPIKLVHFSKSLWLINSSSFSNENIIVLFNHSQCLSVWLTSFLLGIVLTHDFTSVLVSTLHALCSSCTCFLSVDNSVNPPSRFVPAVNREAPGVRQSLCSFLHMFFHTRSKPLLTHTRTLVNSHPCP